MNKMPTKRPMLAAVLAVSLILPGGLASAQNRPTGTKSNSRILYHDGRVMVATSNLYFLYYGCWDCGFPGSNPETQALLLEFATSFGGSPYAAITTTYPDMYGMTPSGGLVFGGAVEDRSYSRGSELTDEEVASLVTEALDSGLLPVDTRGIVMVLPSSDVSIPGLSDGRCQYHGNAFMWGLALAVGLVTNPMRAPSICAPQFATMVPPNGNLAFDAMASWMSHVIVGALTNPSGGGWYDRYGLESSDKCQNTYGSIYTTASGGHANVRLGRLDLLLQQNWVNAGRGYCGLQP